MSREDVALQAETVNCDAAVETTGMDNPILAADASTEALILEAQRLLADPNNINKPEGLQNSLSSLLSLLSSSMEGTGISQEELIPIILEQLPEQLQESGRQILLAPEDAMPEPESEWVEQDARLSESILWKLQEEYYSNMGIDAWKNVPFFVTSSVFIAESYAEMIVSFLKDYVKHLDKKEPVYIVEMATGCGRFSFYLLKELKKKMAYFSCLKDVQLKYIMTDFTEKNICFWESHESFKPFIDCGMLDFAIYRPEEFQFITLRKAKVKLSNQTVKNPLIGIANYFFDSIRQDAFHVDDGVLREGKISLWREFNEEVRPSDPVRVGQLSSCYNYYDVDAQYYQDERYNEMLRYYRDNFYRGHVIFPLGALNCVRNLLNISGNNLVLISSDKGFTDMEFMLGLRDQEYAIHDGAFSFMVNYHALRLFFEQRGGSSFHTRDKNLDLNTQISYLTREKVELEQSCYTFMEKVERANPINYVYMTQHLLDDNTKENFHLRLSGLMAFFRTNLSDPTVFCRFASQMFESLDYISHAQRIDLIRLLDEVWDNYYQFCGEGNVSFWIAQILFGLNMHEKAIGFFEKTIEIQGAHETVYYLMGKSYEGLGNLSSALECYRKSAKCNECFSPTREALCELEVILKERNSFTDMLQM